MIYYEGQTGSGPLPSTVTSPVAQGLNEAKRKSAGKVKVRKGYKKEKIMVKKFKKQVILM